MSNRPTLLIVSYHFAPSPLVGAKRFSFLVREFSRQGFDVHVVTNEPRGSAHGRDDHSLPLCGTVHRVAASFEPAVVKLGATRAVARRGLTHKIANAVFRRLLAPVGWEYFWAGAATRKALEIARDLPPGVVIATSPPHAALLAGARISRRLRWPLILDYRDPWSAYDWPQWYRGGIHRWLAARIESRLVRRSAARVLNTPDMREWFEETFPFAPAKRNFVVPNGFDAVPTAGAPEAGGPLNLVHAGEIYGNRTLVPLLHAAERLAVRHPHRPIHVTSYGALPAAEWQRIRAAGLERFIEQRPRIPFAALFPILQKAHALLAIVSDHMAYSTPYKVYDYMAAGRPILGLAPRDAALHQLLAESGAGECADPGDIPGIEQALERCLFGAERSRITSLESYRWSNLAQRYLAVIESVCGGGGIGDAAVSTGPADGEMATKDSAATEAARSVDAPRIPI
jgi:glycosyltransferase involved in cell wall biosynthesis